MSNYFLSGDDFYQHVNSEWLNDPINKIPEDYSSWGGFIKLHDDGLTKQINIVKNMENINRNEEEEKIFAIWKASENRFKSWEENNSDCNPILNELNILNEMILIL